MLCCLLFKENFLKELLMIYNKNQFIKGCNFIMYLLYVFAVAVLSESNDVKKREINAQLKLKICEHEQKKALQGKSCSQSLNVPDMMKKSPGMMKQTAIKDQKSKISTTGNVLQQTLSKPLTPQKLILPKTDNNLKASPHKNAIVASPVPTAAASLFLMNSQALPSPVLLLSPLTGNTVDGVVPSLQSSAIANTFSINTALKKPLVSFWVKLSIITKT